jgi:FAD/FMN-containing dehydrogenase
MEINGTAAASAAVGEPDFLAALANIVGEKWLVTTAADAEPFLVDWRGLFRGQAVAVVRPKTTAEVASVVRTCHQYRLPVVPQGGNTGLVGGAVPDADGAAVLIHLGRMNQIRAVDAANYTISVEAGCILQTVQEAAAQAGRLFPLSLGAEGSCQIGGNIATNAGGMRALRYGIMRDLVLGLEVVLADGTVWNGLKRLRKNNVGYDLKQLFIGSEGTLGVITAAVLKLFPAPKQRTTALIAVRDVPAAIALLSSLREASGDEVDACELMPRASVDLALKHISHARDPLDEACEDYLLVELASARESVSLQDLLEGVLGEAFEDGRVTNAVIAANETQASEIWLLREAIVEAQRLEAPHLKLDVSVPVSDLPLFLAAAKAGVEAIDPALRCIAFGHVGDGNVHFNVLPPEDGDIAADSNLSKRVVSAVYDTVMAFDGSISAEHGIGQLKREDLARYQPGVEAKLMGLIKQAMDPDRLMNPGKLLT